MPGVCAKRVQMLGPAPSASGEPSIWCAAVAAPHRNPFGNEKSFGMEVGPRKRGIGNGMYTVTCQNTGTNRASVMSGRAAPAVSPAEPGRQSPETRRRTTNRGRHGPTTGETMASVQLDNLRKEYPNGVVGVAGASFEVADGELLVLVGPSGCGKSTLLRMIAGLEEISAGTLRIGDRVVNDVPPKDRDIAMVFQSYALYPHMTVG